MKTVAAVLAAAILTAVGYGAWLTVQTREPERALAGDASAPLNGASACESEYLEAERRIMTGGPDDIDDDLLRDRYGENAERMRDVLVRLQRLNAENDAEWTPSAQDIRLARVHCLNP